MKHSAAILGIATVVPPVEISSNMYTHFMTKILQLDEKSEAVLKRIVDRSEIQKRYSIISDYVEKPSDWSFFNPTNPAQFPTTQVRNDIYKKEALEISYRAAKKLLEQWSFPAGDITHIIFVSCTGLMAPGIECLLVNKLELKPTVQRYALNFMGCFGAFRALSLAQALSLQDAKHRILIVCTELCSLHIQPDIKVDTIIGNSLFADGSAALLVGAQPRKGEHVWWEIIDTQSTIIENSPAAMTWDVSDAGFVMRLSPEIPQHLQHKIFDFAQVLIAKHALSTEIDWVVHPGGKAIIQAIEKACALESWQTESSWNVLKNFGNMSSVSIPFVLNDLMAHNPKKWALALGFGPGLSVEGMLLKKGPDEKEK